MAITLITDESAKSQAYLAKHAEESIRESEMRFRRVVEGSMQGIMIRSWEQIQFANLACARMFGYDDPDELVGQPWHFLVAPEEIPTHRARAEACLRGESVPPLPGWQGIRKDGKRIWLESAASPFNWEGQPAILGFVTDITERKRSDECEALYRLLTENSNDLIYLLDIDGRIVYASPSIHRLCGMEAERVLGTSAFANVHPDDQHAAIDAWNRVVAGEGASLTLRLQHEDGTSIWIELHASPVQYRNQPHVMAVGRDLTERKKTEAVQVRLTAILEATPDLVAITHLDGPVTYLNPSGRRMLECAETDTIRLSDHRTPEMVAFVMKEAIPTAIRDGMWQGETSFVSRSGRTIPVSQVIVAHKNAQGTLDFISTVACDISERKRAEKELILFRALVDQSNDGIEIVDPETGRFLDMNERACRAHGYTREEYLARTVADLDPIEGGRHWPETVESVRRTGFQVFENQHKRKDGSIFPVEVHVSYVHLDRDYMIAMVHDITDRKRAEQRNAAHHAVTRVLASSPSLADAGALILEAVCEALRWDVGTLWRVDAAAQELRCVQTWQKPSLHSEEFELVTKELTFAPGVCLPGLIWSSREPQWIADVVQEPRFQRAPFAAKLGLHGGLAFPILFENNVLGVLEFFSHEIKHPDEDLLRMMAAIGSQIGQFIERKRAEEAMHAGELRARMILDTANDSFVRIDTDGRILEWNRQAETAFGWSRAEVVGRALSEVIIPDQYRQEHERGMQVFRATGQGPILHKLTEVTARRRDGSEFPAELVVWPIRVDGTCTISAFVRDITERKQLEDQFRQAQKMEAIGKLAGGIAHDFNNLLTVIMGYSDVVFERLRAGDPLRDFVDEVRKSGARAASLTRQLLAFSRKQILVADMVDLNSLLKEMENMLTRLIGEDIDLKFATDSSLWKVKVDAGQTEQVIMNLVVNAKDAMPQGGKLTIETANVQLDETYTKLHPYTQPGPYVLVSVSDTGCGMDEAIRLRVFEPFFTTKGPEKGTGLGLSTVYGIVKQSSGFIEVYSEPGKGTTFKVYLPRASEELPKKKTRSVEIAPRSGAETVLLVEDETGVRTLARLVLEKEGYTVIEARNGGDALLLSQQHGGTIHCSRSRPTVHAARTADAGPMATTTQ